MKKVNWLIIISLSALLVSCGGNENLFSINESKLKAQYTNTESLVMDVTNPENIKIDSVVVNLDGVRKTKATTLSGVSVPLANEKLGMRNVITTVHFEGKKEVDTLQIEIVSGIAPKALNYTIVATYPHDSNSYTQGLEFYNGLLYEGTGQYGESALRKNDYKTGNALERVDLDKMYFGEGITFLHDKIYQLTWQENTAFVYDAKTMKKIKQITYEQAIEGWGLTTDGKNLYMTDSSNRIRILNPENFKEIDHVDVYSGAVAVPYVNELEWVNGKIFGNVYQKDAIAVIDPKTGAVTGILNMADLKSKITKTPETDVLNGIAYRKETDTYFITGKNWDKMFEIKISE